MAVADLGLIGEETGNRPAEIRGIVLPVCFVDGVQQDFTGSSAHHVDIVAVGATVASQAQGIDAPAARRHGERQAAVLQLPGQIHLPRSIQLYRRHPHQTVIVKPAHRLGVQGVLLHQVGGPCRKGFPVCPGQREGVAGLCFPQHFVHKALAAKLRRGLLHRPCGVSRGEMAVVQNPHLHPAVSGFLQNDVQVMPPPRSQKIGVRPALHTDGVQIGVVDDLHIEAKRRLILAMEPQKGKNASAGNAPGKCCLIHAFLSIGKTLPGVMPFSLKLSTANQYA